MPRTIQIFDERDRREIRWLVEHFHLPHVRTIDEMFPEEFAAICERLRRIVDVHNIDRQFRHEFLDAFQIKDVARLIMKDGGLLSWEQGLGKTIASMLYAKGAGLERCLFVVPQDLIPQWMESAEKFFMTDLRLIRNAKQARRVRERLRAGHTGWYITYYEALSQAGKEVEFANVTWDKDEEGFVPHTRWHGRSIPLDCCPACGMTQTPDDQPTGKLMRLFIARHGRNTTQKLMEARTWKSSYGERSEASSAGSPSTSEAESDAESADCSSDASNGTKTKGRSDQWASPTSSSSPSSACSSGTSSRTSGSRTSTMAASTLTSMFTTKKRKMQWVLRFDGGRNPQLRKAHCTRCGYNHLRRRVKPAYYHLRDVFDLVVVDEGTKIKNLDSQMSQAVQGLRAPHRLLLTGTPIKNYVPDAFALMWWVLGDNSPRFPFSREGGKTKFEKEFSVIQYKIDKKGRKKNRKVLPRVSNVIGFWRLANAGCIRRTKKNAGIPVVPCRWHDLRAPFGTAQARAYKRWLDGFVDWFIANYDLPICSYPHLVKRDRAMLGQYAKLQFMCTLPGADRHSGIDYGSFANFTPKNVAVVKKACDLVDAGRKVVIFSAVQEFPLWAANVFNRMGYPALSTVRLAGDGATTVPPAQRARVVRDFKAEGFPILCATMQAMNLGHNLDCASAAILNGLPFDWATFDQTINRVHRITSLDPVDIYVAITCCNDKSDDFLQGASLDQKIRKLLREKGQCSSLALDGALPDNDEETVDLRQFLKEVERSWKEPISTLDERHLRRTLENPTDLLAIAA